MGDLPRLAISVRQPWAWAIIHAGKDVENRSQGALRHMKLDGVERLAIHASKGMTRDEYEDAAAFMREIGVTVPPARELIRGAIIGHAAIAGVVKESASPWFFGPRAIVLAEPHPCDPAIAAVGQLGLFEWKHDATIILPPLAKWMVADLDALPAPTPELPLRHYFAKR